MRPHSIHQLCERRDDIGYRLVLLHDVVGSEMHGDYIGGVGLEPAIELVLVRDVDGQEARVAFVVAVILVVAAVVLGLAGADPVDARPLGGLEPLPK